MNKIMPAMALIGGLWAGAAMAQTAAPAAPADPCATTACRKAVKDVVIRVDAARYQTISIPQSPYVLPGPTLLIFPGETLAIQLTVEGDKIVGAKLLERLAPTMAAPLRVAEAVVPNPEDASLRKFTEGLGKEALAGFPANVMLLSYGQMKGEGGAMLTAQHNVSGMIKVDAIIAIIGPNGYVQKPTSTCPMMQNVALFEHWQDNLGPIVLTKPRFLPAGAPMTCS